MPSGIYIEYNPFFYPGLSQGSIHLLWLGVIFFSYKFFFFLLFLSVSICRPIGAEACLPWAFGHENVHLTWNWFESLQCSKLQICGLEWFGRSTVGFKNNHQFINGLNCKGGQESHSRSQVYSANSDWRMNSIGVHTVVIVIGSLRIWHTFQEVTSCLPW